MIICNFINLNDHILKQILKAIVLHMSIVKKSESESRSVVSDSVQPNGLYSPWDSPGQNTGMRSLSLPQGIFPTQESNPHLLHCRRILCQLSHEGALVTLCMFYCSNRCSISLFYRKHLFKI